MNAQSAGSRPSPLRHSLAVAVLGILACATAATAHAQASAKADEVRAYNAQVLSLQSQLRRGAAGSQAAAVLAARATALRSLMATDPTAAEKLAFPAAVLEQLVTTFPNQATNLEQRGRWEGELEFTIEDGVDLKSHREVYRLHRGSEVLDVQFSGREPPGLKSGQKLGLSGVRSGRRMEPK